MKVFRKLREGMNPEVEIGEFLTIHTEFRAFPRLLGTIDLEDGDTVTTVAAVQDFVPSVGDAWSWITERIGDPEIRARTIEAARRLGVRTGEMHIAFASGRSDGFVPEVASGAYADAVRAESLAELNDTIDQLGRRGVGGSKALGVALEGALDALTDLEGTMITRIHGDYHLGQVLRTRADDFAILDFEGEPTRSLAERRAKASPLRDVAGMLRSFDYAAETGRRNTEGDTASIDAWYGSSRDAFMDGYDATVRENSTLMRGWERGARPAVLAAFELHKALYEVRYELGNRPDWLEIPLNALRRIAGVDTG
jgi:trehalose synthase-fused probable maltokinase